MAQIIPFPHIKHPAPWPDAGMLCLITACLHNRGRGCSKPRWFWEECTKEGKFRFFREEPHA